MAPVILFTISPTYIVSTMKYPLLDELMINIDLMLTSSIEVLNPVFVTIMITYDPKCKVIPFFTSFARAADFLKVFDGMYSRKKG